MSLDVYILKSEAEKENAELRRKLEEAQTERQLLTKFVAFLIKRNDPRGSLSFHEVRSSYIIRDVDLKKTRGLIVGYCRSEHLGGFKFDVESSIRTIRVDADDVRLINMDKEQLCSSQTLKEAAP